jgi:hypothetical protein
MFYLSCDSLGGFRRTDCVEHSERVHLKGLLHPNKEPHTQH